MDSGMMGADSPGGERGSDDQRRLRSGGAAPAVAAAGVLAAGRPATLDVDVIIAAAVKIADRDGLGGVTIPKVAKSLGLTGMSLYRHPGSKDELLTLMADAAMGTPPDLDTGDWRQGLRAWALAQREVFRRRPWLTRVPTSGPPSGPHGIAWLEAGLAILSRTRLDWAHKVG